MWSNGRATVKWFKEVESFSLDTHKRMSQSKLLNINLNQRILCGWPLLCRGMTANEWSKRLAEEPRQSPSLCSCGV